MLDVATLAIPDVKLITPRVHRDERGFFLERYGHAAYAEAGIRNSFIQDNHSRSSRGTVRGLHFQRPSFAQAKLVSVTRGTVFDVAVDIRVGSPWFGQWVGAILDDKLCQQLFVPRGFAHGFSVHSEVADVLYKVDAPYAPDLEGGIRWDDADLAIDWGIAGALVSAKDQALPVLADLESAFNYVGSNG